MYITKKKDSQMQRTRGGQWGEGGGGASWEEGRHTSYRSENQ